MQFFAYHANSYAEIGSCPRGRNRLRRSCRERSRCQRRRGPLYDRQGGLRGSCHRS